MRIFVIVLLFGGLVVGCSPSEQTIQTAIAMTRNAQPTAEEEPSPDLPIEEEEPTNDLVYIPCDANKWSVVPTEVITVDPKYYDRYERGGDPGFKHLVIPIAVENNSSYSGKLNFNPYDSYIRTEDEFVYPVDDFGVTSEFPYVYEGLDYSMLDPQALQAKLWTINSQYRDEIIPPGMAVHGRAETRGILDPQVEIYGFPGSWYQLVYKVAETQETFVVTIPKANVTCVMPDGQIERAELGPLVLNLNTDVRSVYYPTQWADVDYKSVTEPIEIAGKGTLEFLGFNSDTNDNSSTIKIRWMFTNASAGYETSGNIQGYLIGSKGLIRPFDFYYSAGPSLSAELELEQIIGPGETGQKMVWIKEDGTLEVYDLPDDY